MAEPKQNMSQPTREEHGNIEGLSYENSRGSLFWKTVWYVGTRPVNLIFYGITWFHLYLICQFGGLHKNLPILLFCLLWWIGVAGYGFYLWICYSRKGSLSESRSGVSEIKAEDVKWYIRRVGNCQLFLKDKSVVTANLQELDHDEKDFLDLKLSTVNALGKRKYRLAAGIFLAVVTVYGSVLVVKSAMPYHGKLSWYLDDLKNKRSVILVHDNIYELGIEGILKDIRDKVKLPEKLCPENEAIVPVRYLYMGYQEFPEEEVGYIADYYPEESIGHMANNDLPEEAGHMAENEAGAEVYVVKEGDTLWKIAEEMLGSSFRYAEIYELNKAIIEETARYKGKKDSGDGYWIFQGTSLRMPEQKVDGEAEY